MIIRKLQIAIVASLVAFAACTTESDSDELLELESISSCIPDTRDLFGFDENSATFSTVGDTQILKFPALWDGVMKTPKLKYFYSGDTLVVGLYNDTGVSSGMNCAVWAEVSVHGELNAHFLQVNAQVFKLEQ